VSINEHVGRFHSGGIVWVIAQKFAGPNKTMTVETEDIGTTMSHARSLEVGCLATLHTRFGSKLGHEVAKTGLFPGTNIPPECPAPGAWKPVHDCGLYGIRHDLYSRGGCVRFSKSVPSSSASAAAIGNLSWACATRSRKESTSDIFRRSASCENERSRGLDFGTFFEPVIC
jgi:hypothetical protein